MQKPRKKKKPASAREPRATAAHHLRWMPEVSQTGELFLRRREVTESGEPGDMNYPFSQGLTFVARRWRNLMNEELRAVGQSQARWGTLYWINVFGDSVNQTELADRIGVEQPTLGRVLRDLEAEGLIERLPGKGDRRAKVIQLTDAAKPVMREIERIQNRVRTRLLNGIDPEDLSTCMAVFAKILVNMDKR
jgi:MarR family transcriptional regulator for hemolysin